MNLAKLAQTLVCASIRRLLHGRTGVWENHWGRTIVFAIPPIISPITRQRPMR